MDLPTPLLGKIFDLTYIDYVEHLPRVPYRYIKTFSGRLHLGDVFVVRSFDYFVRRLDGNVFFHVEKLARFVAGRGRLRNVPFSHWRSRTVPMVAVFDAIRDDRKQDLQLVSS